MSKTHIFRVLQRTNDLSEGIQRPMSENGASSGPWYAPLHWRFNRHDHWLTDWGVANVQTTHVRLKKKSNLFDKASMDLEDYDSGDDAFERTRERRQTSPQLILSVLAQV